MSRISKGQAVMASRKKSGREPLKRYPVRKSTPQNRHSVLGLGSNMEMETIGDRVRALRMAAKGKDGGELTRQELADAVGMHKNTLAGLEDNRQTSTTKLHNLATYFGVRAEWLETGRGVKNAEQQPSVTTSPTSQLQRIDRDRMALAMELLRQLAELQGVPELLHNPVAIANAYELVVAHIEPLGETSVLEILKRLANNIRGETGDGDGS